MYDINYIRNSPKQFDKLLEKRKIEPLANTILELDKIVKQEKQELQQLLTKKNSLVAEIGKLKQKGEDVSKIIQEAEKVKQEIDNLSNNKSDALVKLQTILESNPNLPEDEVPVGTNEEENVEIKTWGEKIQFTFTPKPHEEIGTELKMMDFENATKLSGSRFVILHDKLAKLERALKNFMIDTQINNGYQEMSIPLLVKDKTMYGAGQLPKFAQDSFVVDQEYRLIPTAEVSLVNIVADTIIDEAELPLRYVACSPCFRSEAGAAGRDTRGIIRQHQFYKVELVSITIPQQSNSELQHKLQSAEEILQKLKLPYRVMILCSGDMGFSAQKTYDIEVWIPSQNKYREISSCSNCGDFQARRMNAKFRTKDKKKKFVHCLNGSGLAVGRTLVAILENYQQEDGSVIIPEVLIDYMGGDKIIKLKQ